jgi:hypothetical protein
MSGDYVDYTMLAEILRDALLMEHKQSSFSFSKGSSISDNVCELHRSKLIRMVAHLFVKLPETQ